MPIFEATENENGAMLWNRSAGNTPAPMRRVTPGGLPSAAAGPQGAPTLGNLPPLHLGRVLRELGPDDDLLAEMLEGRLRQSGAQFKTRT